MDKHDKNAQWMCSYLLPSPGGKVVRDLLDKLDDAETQLASVTARLKTEQMWLKSETDSNTRLRGLMGEIAEEVDACEADEDGPYP